MWNRGLEGLRGKRLQRRQPFLSRNLLPLSVWNTKFNKQKVGFGSFLSPLLLEKCFKPRDPSEGLPLFLNWGAGNRRSAEWWPPYASPPQGADTQRSSPECELERRVWAKGQLCQLTEARSRVQILAWISVWNCFLKFVTVFRKSPSGGFGSSVKV